MIKTFVRTVERMYGSETRSLKKKDNKDWKHVKYGFGEEY